MNGSPKAQQIALSEIRLARKFHREGNQYGVALCRFTLIGAASYAGIITEDYQYLWRAADIVGRIADRTQDTQAAA